MNEITYSEWHARVCSVCNPYTGTPVNYDSIENGLLESYRNGLTVKQVAESLRH